MFPFIPCCVVEDRRENLDLGMYIHTYVLCEIYNTIILLMLFSLHFEDAMVLALLFVAHHA